MYETIKKFLNEGGKCLLIEDGKPVGVVLTMEEYEKLQTVEPNPIGGAMIKEMDFPDLPAEALAKEGASAEQLADLDLADNVDVTLEDLGLDELPY